MKTLSAILLATALALPAAAQQTVTAEPYMATLSTSKKLEPEKTIILDIFIMDSSSMAPKSGLVVSAKLSMPSMPSMSMEQPTIKPGAQPGHYDITLAFPHGGDYALAVTAGGKTLTFNLKVGQGAMNGHGMEMKANFGGWPASREGSGTSWMPDSSPMFMKMLPSYGGIELSAMGSFNFGYVDAGGKRGDQQLFSDSMIMLMGRKEVGEGTFGFYFMTSLDPLINGKRGVPDLFQTGETAGGKPLVDRQHPHNLFSELAASYSKPLSDKLTAFVYGGPVGEPALGNTMFMHRASGMEVPEAPITHHWFDSTHISFGVTTLGLVYDDKWKLEGSAFNGHEPGENRYTIETLSLNSASGRLSFNPSDDWSLSASYGYLNSPEALEPGIDQHRLTFSAMYSHNYSNGDNLSATAYFGQNIVDGAAKKSNAWTTETTYYSGSNAYFARFERVNKNELIGVHAGDYTISKLLFGVTRNFKTRDQLDYGIGAYMGVYGFPSSLKPFYGSNPLTFGLFLRIRPSKM